MTISTGYRVYNSYEHFIWNRLQVERQINHNAVVNHVNLFEMDLNYQVTPRLSVIATIPALEATRHGKMSPLNVYRSGGIGDVTVGVQSWVWRPPTESHGNVAISARDEAAHGHQRCEGNDHYQERNGQTEPFDESIQPGDGTWGFSLGTEAYRGTLLAHIGLLYGVMVVQSAGHDGCADVSSSAGRGCGFGHGPIPVARWILAARDRRKPLRGLAFSIGGRMEGVPVRDAFGKSDGFRRPGYVISIEPGMMYEHGRWGLYASGPWAMERNRKTSVTDLENGTHGDAAFRTTRSSQGSRGRSKRNG